MILRWPPELKKEIVGYVSILSLAMSLWFHASVLSECDTSEGRAAADTCKDLASNRSQELVSRLQRPEVFYDPAVVSQCGTPRALRALVRALHWQKQRRTRLYQEAEY